MTHIIYRDVNHFADQKEDLVVRMVRKRLWKPGVSTEISVKGILANPTV